jgi:hypothetical protein
MIIDYLQNLDPEFPEGSITRHNVLRILKSKMDYTWRKNRVRNSGNLNPSLDSKRVLFRNISDKLKLLGYILIYIDECSFNPTKLACYSWLKKNKFSPLIRPATASINLIGAMIDKRKYAFMLKKGATKTKHMIQFFEMLHDKMSNYFGEDYHKHTIFVLDNAKVHSSKHIKPYYIEK